MLGMAEKKNAHKGIQVPFRVEDALLVKALDDYADSVRRSRNMAIILLLEEALKQKGFWPPPKGEAAAEAPPPEGPKRKKK
jgi:hypothetical protein